jgi:hypothetical protein
VAHDVQPKIPRTEMMAVVCPLGFVQGYRCSNCCWAKLLPDAHVPWAVPFCYEVMAKKEFAEHRCEKNR